MELQHIFITPVATSYLKLDNNSLEIFCNQAVSKESYPNNQTDFLDLEEPVLNDLLNAVLVRANSLWKGFGMRAETNLVIHNAWANTNNTPAIDVEHCHPGAMFTAIYYVKGAGTSSGDLVLRNPVVPMMHYLTSDLVEQANVFNSTHWKIPPETGKLVIIPGWIMHRVEKNNSNSPRISIAMDIRLVY